MADANVDFGKIATDIGRAAASFALLTSAANSFGGAVKSFIDFQQAVVFTGSVAGATASEITQMADAARNFSLVTAVSAGQAVTAMQELAQAGFTAQQAMQGLNGVLLLSSATMSDVGQAADLIAASLTAFELPASSATDVANLFTASINSSLASLQKLQFGLRQVGPVAEIAGLSLEQTTAYLDELFNVGLRGQQAGTGLRNVIIRLTNPVGDAQKILRDLGVSVIDATGNFRGLESILQELASKNLSQGQLAKIFGNQALAASIQLMKDVVPAAGHATSSYRDMLDQISNTTTAFDFTLKNLNTTKGSLDLLSNAFADIQRSVGEQFAPAIKAAADYLIGLTKAYRELDPETKTFINYTVGFVAASTAVIGAAAAFGALARALGLFSLASATLGGVSSVIGTVTASLVAIGTTAVATTGALTAMTASEVYAGVYGFFFGIGDAILLFIENVALLPAAIAETTIAFGELFALNIAAFVESLGGMVIAFKAFLALDLASVIAAVGSALGTMGEVALGLFAVGGGEILLGIIAVVSAVAALTAIIYEEVTAWNSLGDAADAAMQKQVEAAQASATAFNRDNTQGSAFSQKDAGNISANLQLDQQRYDSGLADTTLYSQPLMYVQNTQASIDDAAKQLGTISDAIKASQDDFSKNLASVNEKDRASIIAASNQVAKYIQEKQPYAQNMQSYLSSWLVDNYGTEIAKSVIEYTQQTASENELLDRTLSVLHGAQEHRAVGLTKFLQSIASGDTTLPDQFKSIDFAKLLQNKQVITDIVNKLKDTKGAINLDDILRTILSTDSNVSESQAGQIIASYTAKQTTKVIDAGIDTARAVLDAENLKTRINYEKLLSETSKSLATSLQAAAAGTNLTTLQDAQAVADKSTKQYQAIFDAIGTDDYAGYAAAAQAAFDKAGLAFDPANIPGLVDLIEGKPAIDAIKNYLAQNPNASPADVQAFTASQFAKYQQVVVDLVNASAKALSLSPEMVKFLDDVSKNLLAQIEQVVTNGVLSGQKAVATVSASFKPGGARGPARGGSSGVDTANKIADELRAAQKTLLDAQKTLNDSTRGLTIDQRIDFNFNYDEAAVKSKYEGQIAKLQEQLKSIGAKGKLTDQIAGDYQATIVALQKAEAADLAAVASFENSMKRRDDAIKLFERDLDDLAFHTKNTWTIVAAGIDKGFAEYEKSLVTLTDIVSTATTGVLDTLSKGIGDFIFDTKNAWDSFKKSMLDISKQIFAGFTKGLIQQSISSLTGGGGSIFGNAQQPSQQGSAGTPSVGSSGLIGGILSALGLTHTTAPSGAAGSTAGAAAGGGGILDALSKNATEAADQFKSIFTQFSTSLVTTINTFGAQFVAGLNAATQAASGGKSLGSATFNPVSLSGSGGGAAGGTLGGIFGGIGNSILGGIKSFLGFADGGDVYGAGNGTSDSIPAWLSNGEFVVHSEATKNFRPLLKAINSGAIKPGDTQKLIGLMSGKSFNGFAAGGEVSGQVGSADFAAMMGQGAVNNNVRGGDNNSVHHGDTHLNVHYHVNGGQAPADTFRRSADQHAKQLGAALEKARRNT